MVVRARNQAFNNSELLNLAFRIITKVTYVDAVGLEGKSRIAINMVVG